MSRHGGCAPGRTAPVAGTKDPSQDEGFGGQGPLPRRIRRPVSLGYIISSVVGISTVFTSV